MAIRTGRSYSPRLMVALHRHISHVIKSESAYEHTCFDMTSGDSGVNFEGSMSMVGKLSCASSSSDSESDSSWGFCRVSSPGIMRDVK